MLPKKHKENIVISPYRAGLNVPIFTRKNSESMNDKKKVRVRMRNKNNEPWLEEHKDYYEFFKNASKEDIDDFMGMVFSLKEKLEKLENYHISLREIQRKNAKNANNGLIKKADEYTLSISDVFLKTKNAIIASGGKYNYHKHAIKLTEEKVAPPRGQSGDRWFATTVKSQEKRMKKLSL